MTRARIEDTRVYTHPSGARVIVIAKVEADIPQSIVYGGLGYTWDVEATTELREKIRAESVS